MLAKFIPRPGIFQLIIAYQITRNFPTCKSIYENWSDFQIIVVYRFSAYWLRSSVVSVLISLISGTARSYVAPYINLICVSRERARGLPHLCHGLLRRCTTVERGPLSRGKETSSLRNVWLPHAIGECKLPALMCL